jgi:hypothetical protein
MTHTYNSPVRTTSTFKEIRSTAISAYSYHHPHSEEPVENDFINRITLNFVRHNLTSYDARVKATTDLEEKQAIRDEIHDNIIRRFPALREACEEARFRDWK